MARQPATAKQIGQAIRKARGHLSLKQVEGLTGINASLLCQMEQGKMEPKPKHFRKLHRALNTTPGDLFAA